MDDKFYKTSFGFIANRYEEWQAGRCISRGNISTIIVAEVRGDEIHFDLDDIGNIKMQKSFVFEILDKDSSILPDRIQYVNTASDFNPEKPVVCQLFGSYSTIEYVRFAMTNPDRIVEFYGNMADAVIHTSSNSYSDNSKPSKSQIKSLIDAISNLQTEFSKFGEQTGNAVKAFQLNQTLQLYKIPLCFAWQGYKYGWHTDFSKEGDSLFAFMMFETDIKKNTQDLIAQLKTQSIFDQIEDDSPLTRSLISIYKTFLSDLDSGTIKL